MERPHLRRHSPWRTFSATFWPALSTAPATFSFRSSAPFFTSSLMSWAVCLPASAASCSFCPAASFNSPAFCAAESTAPWTSAFTSSFFSWAAWETSPALSTAASLAWCAALAASPLACSSFWSAADGWPRVISAWLTFTWSPVGLLLSAMVILRTKNRINTPRRKSEAGGSRKQIRAFQGVRKK